MKLDEDDYLNLYLLHYTSTSEKGLQRYWLFELSTLQATRFLDSDLPIAIKNIQLHDPDHNFIPPSALPSLPNIGKLNEFLFQNPSHELIDLDIEINQQFGLSSHDDGEVSFYFHPKNEEAGLQGLKAIMEGNGLPFSLVKTMQENEDWYIKLNEQKEVVGVYDRFDGCFGED